MFLAKLILLSFISVAWGQEVEINSVELSLDGTISELKNEKVTCNTEYASALESQIDFTDSTNVYMTQFGQAKPNDDQIGTEGLATCTGLSATTEPYQQFTDGDIFLAHNWAGVQDLAETAEVITTHIAEESKTVDHFVFLLSYKGEQFNKLQSPGYNAAICLAAKKYSTAKILVIKSYKEDLASGFIINDDLKVERLDSQSILYHIKRHNSEQDETNFSLRYDLVKKQFSLK